MDDISYDSGISKESSPTKVSKEEPKKKSVATQVEAKQDTVTFEKKHKKQKKSENKENDTKGDA